MKILQILVEQCTHLPSNETKNMHTQTDLVRTGSCCCLPCSRRAFTAELAVFHSNLQHIFSISAAYPTRVSDHLMTVGICRDHHQEYSYFCASPGLARARSWRQQEAADGLMSFWVMHIEYYRMYVNV